MISIKHNSRLFYCFNINKHGKAIFQISHHVCNSWYDIEYLNYIFHHLASNISHDNPESTLVLESLNTLSKSIYIHLDIIGKLLEQLGKHIKNSQVIKVLSAYERYWRRIHIIRNCILIHKEKNNFFRISRSCIGTHPKGMYIELSYRDNKNKEEIIEMIPLEDIYQCECCLKQIESILK